MTKVYYPINEVLFVDTSDGGSWGGKEVEYIFKNLPEFNDIHDWFLKNPKSVAPGRWCNFISHRDFSTYTVKAFAVFEFNSSEYAMAFSLRFL